MKVEKRQVICIGLGIIMTLAGFFVEKQENPLNGRNGIGRNSYGQGEREQHILVEGLVSHTVPLEVKIGERCYSEEEAKKALDKAAEELPAIIAGDNESLERVQSKLALLSWIPELGISVRWQPQDRELISESGQVLNQDCPKEGRETSLTARLTAGEFVREVVFQIRVVPPFQTEEEKTVSDFEEFLRFEEERQKYEEEFIFPEEFDGQEISYRVHQDRSYFIFSMLGILAAVLLPIKDRQKQEEDKKKRERQMMMDYSEIVSKLVVFLGAGLPVRKSWERIVSDYGQTVREKGKRAAYEEMTAAYYQMQRGVPELEAYAAFGSRCKILPYRKLAGILEQNVKNGSKSLVPILEAEMEDAFEQRKNMARRLGEEASTKLLLPLFMMLMIVMVVITVPAFLSFGI